MGLSLQYPITSHVYYSVEGVQEPQKDEALCDNYEELKTVNYYYKVLHLIYDRVHGSVSDNNSDY